MRQRSLAHHAIAIVERDRGRIPQALNHARAALRPSRAAGEQREAEVRATLGTTLVFAGQTAKGLIQLNKAMALTTGDALPRVLHLRGCTNWLLGRYTDALSDLSRSVELSRQNNDKLWEGRALGSRADVLRALGEPVRSEADYQAAGAVLTEIGEDVEATLATRNRALVAYQQGDVVTALALMEQAEERYRALGIDPVEQLVDHAMTLLSARLAREAQAMLESALRRADLAPVWRADLLMASARAALVDHELELARSRAREAEVLFRTHRRLRWSARAALLALEATYSTFRKDPDPSGQLHGRDPVELSALLHHTRRVVHRLRRLSDPNLAEALLLMAQVSRDAGHARMSRRALHEAARTRHGGTPLPRAAGWLAAAMLAEQREDRRGLLHACRRGLDAVDEHRRLIGDLELRSLATGYGLDLAMLAAVDAVRSGDARGLLWWTERWRGTALLVSASRPPDDPQLGRDIAALRDVSRRLSTVEGDLLLNRERTRLESAVRARYRHLRSGSAEARGPDLGGLVASLGDTVLLCIVLVTSTLYAVTVAHGRVTLREIGPYATAMRECEFARFTLRRAAYGRRVDVESTGARLQQALLGTPEPGWSHPSVLVVPPASLLTVPFGLLPAFQDTAVMVSPSTAVWQRARGARDDDGDEHTGHVALVTGPGLSTRHEEIVDLRRLHADAVVLSGVDATVEGALRVLDGARLGHIAAHGTFRADAPLFSSLTLADGPLMFHDLDRLQRPPRSIVLSACDSGNMHAIGADEALGLVSAFLALGTRGVVASVDPVNDAATVGVMRQVHAVVAHGGSLAEGLLAARRAAVGDPLAVATAAAFNAWGA